MRDYVKWHQRYADPNSAISHRLRMIQALLIQELAARPGPLRLLSLCAGDARDILGVLEGRPADIPRVSGRLIEIEPGLAAAARDRIATLGSPLEMYEGDASDATNLAGHIPADLVLLVGIFSNIGKEDGDYLAETAATLCASGALMVWTRRSDDLETQHALQRRLDSAGFIDQRFAPVGKSVFGVGVARWPDRPPPPLPTDRKLFSFVL